jgi:hypothetical protein
LQKSNNDNLGWRTVGVALDLASELCQTVGGGLFFLCHIFLKVGKTQDLPSKIWHTVEDALRTGKIYHHLFQ